MTYDPSFDFGAVDLESSYEIGKAAVNAIFFRDMLIWTFRRDVVVPWNNDDELLRYAAFAANGLLALDSALSSHPASTCRELPNSLLDRERVALGALVRTVLTDIADQTSEEEILALFRPLKPAQNAFGAMGAKFGYAFETDFMLCSKDASPRLLPADFERVAVLLGELISTPKDLSLRNVRKVKNVREAQRISDSLSTFDIPSILSLNKVILSGLRNNGGEIRNNDKGAVPRLAPVPLESIIEELEAWIVSANNFPGELSIEDRYREAARLCALYHNIHPTKDGNGRTAHVLTNSCLKKGGLPQFDVPFGRYDLYVTAITQAIEGRDTSLLVALFREYAVE